MRCAVLFCAVFVCAVLGHEDSKAKMVGQAKIVGHCGGRLKPDTAKHGDGEGGRDREKERERGNVLLGCPWSRRHFGISWVPEHPMWLQWWTSVASSSSLVPERVDNDNEMYACVYVYTLMYTCMCAGTCTCVDVYICMRVAMYTRIHAGTCVHVYTCMHVGMYRCTLACTYACVHVFMHARMHACTRVCICVRVYAASVALMRSGILSQWESCEGDRKYNITVPYVYSGHVLFATVVCTVHNLYFQPFFMCIVFWMRFEVACRYTHMYR